MIELDQVSFSYQRGKELFQDYSWQVKPGEKWAVVGRSGCGKTTLLYLLAGLRFPSSGVVKIGGTRLTRPRPRTGLILQDYGLLPWATVRENVCLGLRMRQFYGPDGRHAPEDEPMMDIQQRATEWIDTLGLSSVVSAYPAQISGGQRQRTAIARTLALNPDLLLMDEPFASLDAATRETLQFLIRNFIQQQNLTMILVTHSIEEAVLMGEKCLVLGKTPNSVPLVIENPGVNRPGYQGTPEFRQVCERLRNLLEASL